jgi:bifunctional non-homologous end joining protein LigD
VKVQIPAAGAAKLRVEGKDVQLTNLDKPFWPDLGITKGDLIPVLRRRRAAAAAAHPRSRDGDEALSPRRGGRVLLHEARPVARPAWIRTCRIDHGSENVIDFPVIDDLPSLLWVINLGCIDLNQWYATCDDVDRPDYLHFDLDPGSAAWEQVLEAARIVHDALDTLKMPSVAKTTGSKGIHVYVPIVRGPVQKDVWTFAKALAQELGRRHPKLLTSEYKVAKRPKGRVLVDYNQNAWGRTLASVYSVRPHPRACVSTPVTWKEIDKGVLIEDFRLDNVRARFTKTGDLFKPLLRKTGRVDLTRFL